jgi:hypothetical protein
MGEKSMRGDCPSSPCEVSPHKKASGITGGFLALFSPLSHHPCHSEEKSGKHKQKD